MTQPGSSDSERRLVEVQFADASGSLLADGRFVVEVRDGIVQVRHPLRGLRNYEIYNLDLRMSELLDRTERDELEALRRTVRELKGGGDVATG